MSSLPPLTEESIVNARRTFLIAYWISGLLYGTLLCLFIGTLSLTFRRTRHIDVHIKTLIYISSIMFGVATFQAFMSAHMLLGAFAAGDSKPLDFVLRIDRWDSVLVSTLYTTQEVLGGIVAVYQCFVLWNKNWRVITLPVLLLSGKIAIGYTSCAMFSLRGANQSVFAPSIHSWIQAFYYLAVFQNFTTTSLMGYRIWNTRRKSSPYQTRKDTLLPLLRIVIECPALQLATEILLLILFSRGRIEHYIIFQMVTPIVGISFNAVIIRVRLRALEAEYPSYQVSEDPIQTIGHTRTRIAVQMTTEIEVDDGSKPTPLDVTSEADIALYNHKDHEAVSLEAKKTQDFTNERLRLD